MPRSGLPRVSHAAAAARALCDPHSHHLPTTCLVYVNSDSRCSVAQRSLSKSLSISLSLGVQACVSGGGDALLAGADENSWQSRPRHACASSAFHTPSSRLHAPCVIQQQATVMVLLDAIARNIDSNLVFAASRCDACSHSDLGCAKLSQIRCRSTALVSDTLMAGSSAYAHGRHC